MVNPEESISLSIGNHLPLTGGSDVSSISHLEVCKCTDGNFSLRYYPDKYGKVLNLIFVS